MFELITFFYLIAIGAFLIEIGTGWKTLPAGRQEFNKQTGVLVIAGILAVGWVVIFYGSFIEPRTLIVNEQEIEIAAQSDQVLRAVVVSDVHVGPYRTGQWVKELVDVVMAQDPEIIFLPGDFIFSHPDQVEMLDGLARLNARHGVYAVTGNHDYEGDGVGYVVASLERFGIEVLENEVDRIKVNDAEVVIAGVSDLWYDGNTHSTLADVDEDEVVILLSHNPDAVLLSNADRADLVISGHTHGGQIRLPFLGSVAQVPTMLGNDYDKGLFTYENQQLFISAGAGETGPRARLFNPPEINVLNISF